MDSNGYFWHVLAGAFIGAVVNVVGTCVSNAIEGKPTSAKELLVSAVSGAITGALATTGVGLVGQIVGNAAVSAGSYVADKALSGEKMYLGEFITETVSGGISGAIGGKGMNAKNMIGVWTTSTAKLTTAKSLKKIGLYTAKKTIIKKAIVSSTVRYISGTVSSKVFSNVIDDNQEKIPVLNKYWWVEQRQSLF